jgi:hypothetical protein
MVNGLRPIHTSQPDVIQYAQEHPDRIQLMTVAKAMKGVAAYQQSIRKAIEAGVRTPQSPFSLHTPILLEDHLMLAMWRDVIQICLKTIDLSVNTWYTSSILIRWSIQG